MICQLHRFNPRRRVGKPETYDSCGACRRAYDTQQRRLRWQASERRTARTLGGRRNPGSGAVPYRNRGDVIADASPALQGIASLFGVVEVRNRRRGMIREWASECDRKSDPYRPWLIVWDDPDGTVGPLAVLRLEELAGLLRGWAER